MPFGVVSADGRGMGVLEGGKDRLREGALLGVNVGHPAVTSGILWVRTATRSSRMTLGRTTTTTTTTTTFV